MFWIFLYQKNWNVMSALKQVTQTNALKILQELKRPQTTKTIWFVMKYSLKYLICFDTPPKLFLQSHFRDLK